MNGDVVAVAIPYVTVSISQPSRAYFKLKMGSVDFISTLSPTKDGDMLSTTHSWSLLALTLKEKIDKVNQATFRVEVWQKWSWPWNDTLAGEGEFEFSKILKNHCTLSISDPRRASQSVTMPLQSTNPQISCSFHAFPETASPLLWRQLFDHHSTKLNAMRDLLHLFERGKIKESAKDDKWSFYCDNDNLSLLMNLLRQWSLGTLPTANKNDTRSEKRSTQRQNDGSLSSSDESSSDEEDFDGSGPDDDEALSPCVPEIKNNNALANLTVKVWKMIIPLDNLRSKLGALGLPLMILEILPEAFEHHPRHAMFLMEILYPYMSATNPVTMKLVMPYCIRLSELTQSSISSMMARINVPIPSPSISSMSSSGYSSSSTENHDVLLAESESPVITPLLGVCPSVSSNSVELMPISCDEDNEISSLDLMAPLGISKSPPRKSKASQMAEVSLNMSEKKLSRLKRRETKAQLKEERRKVQEHMLRERSKMRLVTVLFQYLKYLDPKYIPIVLKSPATDAINTVLSFPGVPTNLVDLCVDALKFIGPQYSETLDKRHCFENLWLLSQHTSDVHMKFKVVDTLRQFKTTESKSEKDALNMFIEIISKSTMIRGEGDGTTKAVIDPKMSTIVYKFLRFLSEASADIKLLAFQNPPSIHLMLDYILGSQQSRIMAVQILPLDLPAGVLLKAQFLSKFVIWLKDDSIPWSEAGPTMTGLLRTIFSANIFAPQFPWCLDDKLAEVPLDTEGNPPSTWLVWSEFDAWLLDRKLDLFGEIFKKISPSTSFDSHSMINATTEIILALCSVKRPFLDHLILKRKLISQLDQILWKSGRQSAPFLSMLTKIFPAYCRMILTTYRLGMWQISGYQLCFPEKHGIRETPAVLVSLDPHPIKTTIHEHTIHDIFKILVLVFDASQENMTNLLKSAEVWDAISLMAGLAMTSQPLSPSPLTTFFNKISGTASRYATLFYRYILRPMLVCMASTKSISPQVNTVYLEAIKNVPQQVNTVYLEAIKIGLCQNSNVEWALLSEESPLWVKNEIVSPSHPQYSQYIQYFEDPRNDMMELETDHQKEWQNVNIIRSVSQLIDPIPDQSSPSSGRYFNRYAKRAKRHVHFEPPVTPPSSSSASTTQTGSTTNQNGDASLSRSDPGYWDEIFALADQKGEKSKNSSELPIHPLPLSGIVELSDTVLSLLDYWYNYSSNPLSKYPSGNENMKTMLLVCRFLMKVDPMFTMRWFSLTKFWHKQSPSNLSPSNASMLAEIVLNNVRNPCVYARILDPESVPLIAHCIKHLMDSDFSKVALPEFYEVLKKWLTYDSCRMSLPSSVMESFVAQTSEKIPSGHASQEFSKLLLSFMEPLVAGMGLSNSLSILARLSGRSSIELQSRITDLYASKLAVELQEARDNKRAFQFDPSPLYSLSNHTNFTSASFKTWTILWRAGAIPLGSISAAFDPYLRSTYPLHEKLGSEAFEKFNSMSDIMACPGSSWLFIKDKEMRPTASLSLQTPKPRPFSSSNPLILSEGLISAATESVTQDSSEFGSMENDLFVAEYRERVFRQAEFIGTICHESSPQGQSFFPNGPFRDAVDPSNWGNRDPLPKLIACVFRHWELRNSDQAGKMRVFKRYSTLLVADVAQKMDFFRKHHPIVILAILQTGVMNSHIQYEHQLYPALYEIYKDRLCERHRAWRIMKDMVACASRHPAAFCKAVPVYEVFNEALTLGHEKLASAAWRLLGAVSMEPKILNFLRKNTEFVKRLVAIVSASTTIRPHKSSQYVALQLLVNLHTESLDWLGNNVSAIFNEFVPSLSNPNELTHICATITYAWIQRVDLFDRLIPPHVLHELRNRLEMIPRQLELLFPYITRNVTSSIDSFLDIAVGRDENGIINNGVVIGRYLVMLAAFEDEAVRSTFILGPTRLNLFGASDLLSRTINSASEWQSFHKFSGLVDLSVAVALFSESARELLGSANWRTIGDQWSNVIVQSGKHHPIFDYTAKILGLNSKQYVFKPSEVEFQVPKNPVPLSFSTIGGRHIFAPMNTVYSCVHGRPTHLVINQAVSWETMSNEGLAEFQLYAMPATNVQIPAHLHIGFASASAIETLKAHPHLCVGQVEGSYAFSSDLASIHCNGHTIHTTNAQTTSRRMNFVLSLNAEYQTISIAFNAASSAANEHYHIWSVDLSEPLYPVISFQNSACYIFDYSWKESMTFGLEDFSGTKDTHSEPKVPTTELLEHQRIIPAAPITPVMLREIDQEIREARIMLDDIGALRVL